MKTNKKLLGTIFLSGAFLAGCGSPAYQPAATQTNPTAGPSYSSSYGVVDSIQVVNAPANTGIGMGSVAGGVVGGVLGNQVGGGSGRTAATAAGAIGGAIIGHQIEQRNRAPTQMYQIGVRLDNGTYQTITQDTVSDFGVGHRVRIENGRAYRY